MSFKVLQAARIARILVPRLQHVKPMLIWQCENTVNKDNRFFWKPLDGTRCYCSYGRGLFDSDDFEDYEPGPSRKSSRRRNNTFFDEEEDGFDDENSYGRSRPRAKDGFIDEDFDRGSRLREKERLSFSRSGGDNSRRNFSGGQDRGFTSRDQFRNDNFRRGGNSTIPHSLRGSYGDNHFQRGGFSRDDSYDNLDTPEYSGGDLAFDRDAYKEHPNVTARSMEEVANFMKSCDIVCNGDDVPKPVMTFEEANFPGAINGVLKNQNFKEPTSIQRVTWPLAMSGRDVIGIAQTGSGKTLGFILPALVHIQKMKEMGFQKGPFALVLAPTRELCQQIAGVTKLYARACGLHCVAVFGGGQKFYQREELRRGADIVIATPGRLCDLTSSGELSLSKVAYFVLDEADRMLDMGFEPQIRKVERQITKNRQTLMWSATWPSEIRRLGRQFLKNPVEFHVGSHELTANPDIHQVVKVMSNSEKRRNLIQDLKQIFDAEKEQHTKPKILIFVNQKRFAEDLTDMIYGQQVNSSGLKISADSLHGDKQQRARDSIVRDFQRGNIFILVATDVAARGLDVDNITHVINYDFPRSVEDYIHRIGRTGRAGKKGTAISYFTDEYFQSAAKLVQIMEEADQPVPVELQSLASVNYGRQRSGRRQPNYSRKMFGY